MPCVLHGAVRLVAAFTGTMSTVLRRTRPGERADLFFPDVNPEREATNRLLYHCTAAICSIPLSVENDTVCSKEITSPLSVSVSRGWDERTAAPVTSVVGPPARRFDRSLLDLARHGVVNAPPGFEWSIVLTMARRVLD
jgi:hypothetical protein